MSSFIGGIILVLSLQAGGFFAMRFLKSKEQSNYDPMWVWAWRCYTTLMSVGATSSLWWLKWSIARSKHFFFYILTSDCLSSLITNPIRAFCCSVSFCAESSHSEDVGRTIRQGWRTADAEQWLINRFLHLLQLPFLLPVCSAHVQNGFTVGARWSHLHKIPVNGLIWHHFWRTGLHNL